jgi:hypothetical protein
MNSRVALVLIGVVALGACLRTEAERESAPTFSSVPGSFSVRAPARFREEVKALDLGKGAHVNLHSFSGDADDVVYVVTYVDYPPELVASFDRESMLDRVVKGQVTETHGQLIHSDRIMLGEHHGRTTELEVAVDGIALTMRGRDYLVGNRLYQMFTMQKRGQPDALLAQSFLDSFEFSDTRIVNGAR